MKLFDLALLAERWNTAYTLAAVAWGVVAVLGIAVLVRNNASTYPAVGARKTYAAENATFQYPENWTINNCEPGKPFIELPGTIRTNYKEKRYELKIYGTGAYQCIKDRPERLDLYPEDIAASGSPCAPASSTEGERLQNGLYLRFQQEGDDVLAVHVKQNSCYAPADTVVLAFAFSDPDPKPGDTLRFGLPRVDKEAFLESRQYKDIRALAESVKY